MAVFVGTVACFLGLQVLQSGMVDQDSEMDTAYEDQVT